MRDLDLLRDRNFRTLLIARTVSVLGSGFAPVALAFGVLDIPGATASTLSWVLAAEAVPMVLFMLIGGVIADRMPRNLVMTVGQVFNSTGFLALGLMLLTGWTPMALMMSAAALTGIGMAVMFPALTGIIPDVVPADRLQSGNGMLALGANSARILGAAAAAPTVALVGGGWALLVSSLMYATAGTLIATLRLKPSVRGDGSSSSVLKDLAHGWREFVSHQWIWVIVAQFSVLVMALQAAHGVIGPVLAKTELGGPSAWGKVLVGEAVGTVVGVMVAMRIRPKRPMLVGTLCTFPAALPYLLLGLDAPLWLVMIGAFAMGFCFDLFGVLWQTTMQRVVPPESLSRVSSYDALGSLMFGPIGLLLAGPLVIAVGPRPALIGCGIVVVATTLAALCSPSVRTLRAPAPVETVQASTGTVHS